MASRSNKIVVAGAGSVGCYIGGCLALAGRNVALFGRLALMDRIEQRGLRVTDLEGRDRAVAKGKIEVQTDAEIALGDTGYVLVTVKSGATDDMASLIDEFAPPDAVIISLQNGVRNVQRLRSAMKRPREILTGMVPFNVVLATDETQLRVHKATQGSVLIERGVAGLAELMNVDGCATCETEDMRGVLWGKLLLNLNNALNALSGLPLAQELSDRRWRRLLAQQMDEALRVMRKAGIKPTKLAAAPPGVVPIVLRLPDRLFALVAKQMLAVDPHARSSMWDDLHKGRITEISEFQGVIAELGRKHQIATPLTDRIIALVLEAEQARCGAPALTPYEIMPQVVDLLM